MLPIPAFNPGDTTVYPSGNGTIQVGAADAGSKMLLYNESPFNINIDFLNGSQSILHAWEARYWTLDGDTRQVEWDINSALNVTSAPISLVIGELYGPTDKLEGTYPMGLIRQTNVGNPGGVATTSSTGITNDNNNAGTPIVESTVAGVIGSSVSLTNDAIFKLLVLIAGTLTQVLKTNNVDPLVQIGAATHLAEILGNLTVDGNMIVKGTSSLDNGTFTTDGAGNATVHTLKLSGDKLLYSGGGNGLIDATSGVDMYFNPPSSTGRVRLASTATFNFVSGRVARFDKQNASAPAGSYPTTFVYTHNLGYIADYAWVQPGDLGNTTWAGSATTGVGGMTSTTCRVTLGAQMNFIIFFIKLDP